jgi:hypothetical protein
MNIVSLGSDCTTSFMIKNADINPIESELYTHLFTWSAVKINHIIKILQNPDLLKDNLM